MKNDRFLCPWTMTIALATALFGALLTDGNSRAQAAPPAGSEEPHFGTTLLYEVVAEKGKVDPATVENTVRVLDRRVNTTARPTARVRRSAGGQIEIGIYSRDRDYIDIVAEASHIKSVIEWRGILEFRILANSHDHQKLIDRARGEPKKKELKDEKGAILARWVLVRPKEVQFLKGSDMPIVMREAAGGGIEILVVHDRFNVNDTHLKEVTSAMDEAGGPEVSLTFDSKGGELFGKFTSDNLPVGGAFGVPMRRKLGIILDDRVISAPSIQSKITDRARIAGNFTQQEVDDIVAIFRSGRLPCKIKLISKKELPAAKK